MKFAHDILRKPKISEKSMSLAEGNKYVFEVDPRSNKTEIRQAVEQIFKVKVLKVNTIRMKGKLVRRRNALGRTPEVKKAIVTLRPGDKIEIFEGV